MASGNNQKEHWERACILIPTLTFSRRGNAPRLLRNTVLVTLYAWSQYAVLRRMVKLGLVADDYHR